MGRDTQLRFTRPGRRAQTSRMTDRQERLLGYLRWEAKPIAVDRLGVIFDYKHPRAAADRLVARGLVVRVSVGVYKARTLRERRA